MALFNGTGGSDFVLPGFGSTAAADLIRTFGGDDYVEAGGGNDVVFLGAGNDEGHGGAGSDTLWGDGGQDLLFGDAGADFLHGGDAADVLWGGNGNDQLWGDAGADLLIGGNGVDILWGGDGNDIMAGGGQSGDELHLGNGANVVFTNLDETTIGSIQFVYDFNANDVLAYNEAAPVASQVNVNLGLGNFFITDKVVTAFDGSVTVLVDFVGTANILGDPNNQSVFDI